MIDCLDEAIIDKNLSLVTLLLFELDILSFCTIGSNLLYLKYFFFRDDAAVNGKGQKISISANL